MMTCIGVAYLDFRKRDFEPPNDKTNNATFAGPTDRFVGFIMPRLNFHVKPLQKTLQNQSLQWHCNEFAYT